MRALIIALKSFNGSASRAIQSAAVPGLGTGYGQMEYGECVRQMYLAYKFALDAPRNINWIYASQRQKLIIKRTGNGNEDI